MSSTPSGPPATRPAPTPDPPRPRRLWVFGVLALLVLLVGGAGGSYQGRLAEVQKNDNSSYLPSSAESTRVQAAAAAFSPTTSLPGFLVYQRQGGLTAPDRAKIASDVQALRGLDGVAGEQVGAPQVSADGSTAAVTAPLIAKRGDAAVTGPELAAVQAKVEAQLKTDVPAGLTVHTAGPGGLLSALIEAFQGIDGTLLLVAGIVVVVLLLIVYRSPVLWFFPLFSAVLSLGLASIAVYFLAENGLVTLNGQSQGILSVLVIGAGTDYALLLISRYREELHVSASRVTAMVRAWRGAAPAIGASAATVVIGLLCLLVSELNSNRGLGPVAAIGIACTLLVMLTFLPVALVLCGRWVFWPRIPRVDQQGALAAHGAWAAVATTVSRRPRRAWVASVLVLVACVALVPTLRADGLATVDGFTNDPDAVQGQRIFDAQFDRGTGAPAVVLTGAAQADAVIAAARTVPGVAQGPGAVCRQPDYRKLAAAAQTGTLPATAGCPPPSLAVTPIGGRTLVDAQLTAAYDTPEAYATIARLRAAVHAVPGAQALVGGQSALTLDVQDAARHDRNLILPLVLAVILVVLTVLLRSLVAPLLLIGTVVLSFTATLGVCAFFFTHVFGFAGADTSFPLFAFIFLVALGIDYNIFLMTRVREETVGRGTRAGVLRGLTLTGGVITSAGIVLASTFAVLGVLPLVALAEIGFAVAFGVLLDTFLVRSVLVPALAYDLGKVIWWPSRLARGRD